MINIEMIEITKGLNVKKAGPKNTTNIKMINIKMMNIIIKLKTRIKRKTNMMMVIKNKTTDKSKIIVVKTANATKTIEKAVTEKKSKIIKSTQAKTTKAMKTTIMALSCRKKERSSIELRRIQINNKITSNHSKFHMTKKMKSIIKSMNKDKLTNLTEAAKNLIEVLRETAEAEEEAAEAKENTCQRTELRVKVAIIIKKLKVMITKKMLKAVKEVIDLKTTNITIMVIPAVAIMSTEMTTKAVVVEREVEEVEMERSITITNNTTTNKEMALLEETNSESDINRITKKTNLLFLKTENSPSTQKINQITLLRPSFKSSLLIDLPP